MRILICGADGFLGSHIAAVFARRGHEIVRGVHTLRLPGDVAIDYREDITGEIWTPRLAGIDAVVNAIGILREKLPGDFDLIHHRAPAALFESCRDAGIHRVVQISALGAAPTPYLTSKHAADAVLHRLLPEAIVLRPGLVFGPHGASTRFFLALASLPVQTCPGGAGDVQPVHVDDLAEIVARLIDEPTLYEGVLELPGPRRLSYAEWMASYRAGMGFQPAFVVPVPGWCVTASARIAGLLPGSLLSRDTWTMLRAGSTGNPAAAEAVLGRPLLAPQDFIPPRDAEPFRLRALSHWRGPFLRSVLALIWFVSAILSATIFPLEQSLALLAAFGLAGSTALAVLAGAVAVDLGMGMLTIFRPGRRLWLAQLALVAGYSALIAWRLPIFLLHPFGPILKNLAVAALLIQLWAEDETR